MAKKKKWIKPRHRIIQAIAKIVLAPVCKIKYGITVEKFKEEIPRYMIKHQVRPGLTGWAQINGYRGDTSINKRIEYDLYYIENWTLGFDIKIILLTFLTGFIAFCVCAMSLCTVSCTKEIEQDIADLKEQVADLAEKLSALEAKLTSDVNTLNTAIATLKSDLEKKIAVVGVGWEVMYVSRTETPIRRARQLRRPS